MLVEARRYNSGVPTHGDNAVGNRRPQRALSFEAPDYSSQSRSNRPPVNGYRRAASKNDFHAVNNDGFSRQVRNQRSVDQPGWPRAELPVSVYLDSVSSVLFCIHRSNVVCI